MSESTYPKPMTCAVCGLMFTRDDKVKPITAWLSVQWSHADHHEPPPVAP